ncbi:hypothetical protein GJAV_G00254390 [Gymnothorax javanicus]|nr:hypothetical protein GJAV_G00254390 [Gymnothorax javanicus]
MLGRTGARHRCRLCAQRTVDMKLLSASLCLLITLHLGSAAPTHHDIMMADHHEGHHDDTAQHNDKPDRCAGIEFDAIAPDEKGITHYFKGDYLWKGYTGQAVHINTSFEELDDHHHLDHVDAAFRMHSGSDPDDHDHIFFFLNEKVFSYYNHTLEPGFPKDIKDEFPGIPDHLDAAVECPKGECNEDAVIFFKGDEIYLYDITTKMVKQKKWPQMPKCTSAYRWLERYYCFHGHSFTRFRPLTGDVEPEYPKDARNYFMTCAGFSHGGTPLDCTGAHLDAITSDDSGKSYAFRGELYLRLDTRRDGWHPFHIDSTWKEIHGNVDAAFSYDGKVYFIMDDQVYIYKADKSYALVAGYPKPLEEELGIEGHVDAACVCDGEHTVQIIQGQHMKIVDLTATPRTVVEDIKMPYKNVDAAYCNHDGIKVYIGQKYHKAATPRILATSKIQLRPHEVPQEMLGCKQ